MLKTYIKHTHKVMEYNKFKNTYMNTNEIILAIRARKSASAAMITVVMEWFRILSAPTYAKTKLNVEAVELLLCIRVSLVVFHCCCLLFFVAVCGIEVA